MPSAATPLVGRTVPALPPTVVFTLAHTGMRQLPVRQMDREIPELRDSHVCTHILSVPSMKLH